MWLPLLPARKAGILICAVFALLVFVGLSREFMPAGWSFRRLKWQNSGSTTPGISIGTGAGAHLSGGSIGNAPIVGAGEDKLPPVNVVPGVPQSNPQPPPPPPPELQPGPELPEEKAEEKQQEDNLLAPTVTEAVTPVFLTPLPSPTEIEEDDHPEATANSNPHAIDPTRWLDSIRDYDSTALKRLSCPKPDHGRYDYLRTFHRASDDPDALPSFKPYFFALNLHQCIAILPRLLGSLAEVVRVLGPENCAISIVEGRSTDGTYEVLESLKHALPEGVEYWFSRSEIDPTTSGRIGSLAELRNLAIQPLVDHADLFSADKTTVIFFNDVAACADDFLELIHQRVMQQADMTCAMDWNYVDYSGHYRLTFYDVWIARSMSGQSFFHIPFGGSWNESMHLFWSDDDADRLSKARFERGLSFQVFTCWNGGVAFTAKPLLQDDVRFRLNRDDECYQGEVSLFTKDMWIKNYTRIAVVPSVNLAYDDSTARRIHAEKGLPSDWVHKTAREGAVLVPWRTEPPEKVLCIPDWVRQPQYWVDWNE